MAVRAIKATLAAIACGLFVAEAIESLPVWASCDWDDHYGTVADRLDASAAMYEPAFIKSKLYSGVVRWETKRDYLAVHELVPALTATAEGMVRVEIGNGPLDTYGVIWALKTRNALWVITNMHGAVEARALSPDAWDGLLKVLTNADVWNLRSAVNTGIDDASTDFFSICVEGKSTQFAVYGLPTGEEIAPGAQRFAEQVQGQRNVFRTLLNLIGFGVAAKPTK